MQMQGGFNAQQFEPKQSAGTNHPVGRFPFTVTGTSIEENKEKTGGFFMVEFTTPAGVAVMRYNMWNKNPQAVDIANGQLSALCHATGRYQLNWQDEGAAMRGAQGMIEVGFQKDQGPSPERPNGGYTEIKKVLDSAGNEPGKAPASVQPQPSANQAPMTSNGQGGWNNAQQNATQQPNSPPANSPPVGGAGGWQQGGGNNPPAGGGVNQPPPWGQQQR